MWFPADDFLNTRFAAVSNKHHVIAGIARERNRKASDVGELKGAPSQYAVIRIEKLEAPKVSALEGEGRIAIVVPHHADLSAPGGGCVNGVMFADLLDGRIAFGEGETVFLGFRIDPEVNEFVRSS